MQKSLYPPAELKHGDNLISIENFETYISEAERGNPYNTTFDIRVRSGAFCGYAGCEYDIKQFRILVGELREMYDFKRSSVELSEICYGSRVTFTMSKTGQIEVSGEIYGEAKEHSLTFVFSADQSSLLPFIEALEEMIQVK